MEIELKYHIEEPETAKAIFEDPEIVAMMDSDSEESIAMQAIYYDTDDRRLSRECMTFRIRREGIRLVATLKWNGTSEAGMHIREEINVPITEDSVLDEPSVNIFSQSPMCDVLKKLIGRRRLHKMIETEVIRHQVRLDTGTTICELSHDDGTIIAGGNTGRISELEIELFSGSKEEMEELGAKIAQKYALQPENRSKFKRGLDLIA